MLDQVIDYGAFAAFADNFTDFMFWPLFTVVVLAVLVGLISWIQRDGDGRHRINNEVGTPAFEQATYRMFRSAQVALAVLLLYGLMEAVPPPDYHIVKVSSVNKYDEAYNTCWDYHRPNMDTEVEDRLCHQRALLLTYPDLKVVSRPVEKKVKVRVRDPYKTLFDNCVERVAKPDAQVLEQCHEQALEARGD